MEKYSRLSISKNEKRCKISSIILIILLFGCSSKEIIPVREAILIDRNLNTNYGCDLMEIDTACNDTVSMAVNAVFLNDFKLFSNLTGIPIDSLSCYKHLIDLAKKSKFNLKIPIIQFLISEYYTFSYEQLKPLISENYYSDTTGNFNYYQFLIDQTDFSGSFDSINILSVYKNIKEDILSIIQLENFWKIGDYNKLWEILNSIDLNSSYFPYVADYIDIYPSEDTIDNFYLKNIKYFERKNVFSYTKIYYLTKNNENEKLLDISNNLKYIQNATLVDKVIISIEIVTHFAKNKKHNYLRKSLLNSQVLLDKFCWSCFENVSDLGLSTFQKVKAKYDFAVHINNSHFR